MTRPTTRQLDKAAAVPHHRAMGSEVDAWFVREILPHEAALMCFLRRSWRDRDEVVDLRQEIYVRVYEAALRRLPDTPRAFLFTAARNLITDRVRRQRVVSITAVGDLEQLHLLRDELEPERWCSGREALARLAGALDRLPDRCREVVWLRRVEDLPQKEIARRLGISEKTVEKHIAKGSRLVADHYHDDIASSPGRRDKLPAWMRRRKPT